MGVCETDTERRVARRGAVQRAVQISSFFDTGQIAPTHAQASWEKYFSVAIFADWPLGYSVGLS